MRLSVQLVLQYSAVDRMNCLWIVAVFSLLCRKSWPEFDVSYVDLESQTVVEATPRIFTLLV